MKKTNNKTASNSKNNLTKSEINNLIIYLQFFENVCIRSYENGEELKELVSCYTKSISEYNQKHALAENMIFCDKTDKSQTKVNKDGQGFLIYMKKFF